MFLSVHTHHRLQRDGLCGQRVLGGEAKLPALSPENTDRHNMKFLWLCPEGCCISTQMITRQQLLSWAQCLPGLKLPTLNGWMERGWDRKMESLAMGAQRDEGVAEWVAD